MTSEALLFKPVRAEIAQRTMKPLAIVEDLDVVKEALDRNPSANKNRRSAEDLRIYVNDVLAVEHRLPGLFKLLKYSVGERPESKLEVVGLTYLVMSHGAAPPRQECDRGAAGAARGG